MDDPRNTDNSWMETEAVNYHDDTGEITDCLHLEAGDDTQKVKWVDINDQLKLYARQSQFIQYMVEKWGAHWREGMDPNAMNSDLESPKSLQMDMGLYETNSPEPVLNRG